MRSLSKMTLLLPLLFLLATVASAQTSAQKDKKARLEKEIAILDIQIKETAKRKDNALSSLKLTRKKISTRRQLVAESNEEIAGLDSRIASKEDTIAMLKARLDTMSTGYNHLIRTAYRSRDARVWYMYILAAKDLGQGLRRYGYLKSLSSQMRTQAAAIKETEAQMEAQKAEAEKLREDASALRKTRMSELDKLRQEEGDSQKLVSQLNKDSKNYQRQLNAKRKEVEALNKEMQRMVERATRPAASGKKAEVDVKLESEFAKNKGKLPWPAEGPVVEGFGQHYHPVYKNVKMPFNNGVNIAVSPNTAVKAVFEGKVSQVIVMPGYNQCVLVQHGGYFTFYCKLSNVSVKAGDKINTGQVIGLVDTISGETELHFELWEGKNPRNPELWLR